MCQRRGGILERINRKTGRTQYKLVRFNCGKSTCPVCQDRRRRRLIRRLHQVPWAPVVYFWTITTDPNVLDPLEALQTLNRRWHVVHRTLIRICPNFRYFRVLEFTESGLPHIHFITDSYIPWSQFQSILIKHKFGKVLHFKPLPIRAAINYLCKYVTKGVYQTDHPYDFHGRFWAATIGLLPQITYGDAEGEWQIVWTGRNQTNLENMLHAFRLYADRSPPDLLN